MAEQALERAQARRRRALTEDPARPAMETHTVNSSRVFTGRKQRMSWQRRVLFAAWLFGRNEKGIKGIKVLKDY